MHSGLQTVDPDAVGLVAAVLAVELPQSLEEITVVLSGGRE